MSKASIKPAKGYIDFLNASPTPFHACHEAKIHLEEAGYKQIHERDNWTSTVVPGGKYYLTRNASTIVAFAVGKKWKPGNAIAMVGAHTDSCVLKLKAVSKRQAEGYLQVGVEKYGGGMWHTWFDRDLSIAGRLMVKTKDGIEQKLVNVQRPICVVPNLAVHFGGSEPFDFNKETQLFPIAGTIEAELNRLGLTEEVKEEKDTEFRPLKSTTQRHHARIVEIVAEEAGVKTEDVIDFELTLYPSQKACLGGLNNELIFSARQDNLGMTYCSIAGLIRSTGKSGKSLDDDNTIRLIACFDHEEVGSTSAQGANSSLLPHIVRRLSVIPASGEASSDSSYDRASDTVDWSTAYEQTLATSFLISADMTHAVNPNYAAKYEQEHKPHLNKGTVLKVNSNQRYTTNSAGVAMMHEIAARAKRSSYDTRDKGSGVPLQFFMVRNDGRCGSTIGPMLSSKLGSRSVDLGNALLAMHSTRETSGAYDVEYALNLFESFFEHYSELEKSTLVD